MALSSILNSAQLRHLQGMAETMRLARIHLDVFPEESRIQVRQTFTEFDKEYGDKKDPDVWTSRRCQQLMVDLLKLAKFRANEYAEGELTWHMKVVELAFKWSSQLEDELVAHLHAQKAAHESLQAEKLARARPKYEAWVREQDEKELNAVLELSRGGAW
jgi:hypothetical protein